MISIDDPSYADDGCPTGQTEDKSLTEFLQPVMTARKVTFAKETVEFTPDIRACVSAVLGRGPMADADLHTHIAAL